MNSTTRQEELNSEHEISTGKGTKEKPCQHEPKIADKNRLKKSTNGHSFSRGAVTHHEQTVEKTLNKEK